MEIERLPQGQSFGDRHRAACSQWIGMPPGLTPELASKFMLGFHDGKTIRDRRSHTNGHWDRPTCAQARVPIDEIVSGSAMSLFQASQAASMMAS
jgi:hypothetical protein